MLKTKGFTLVELIVVVAIVGILLGLAAPFLTEMIMNARIRNLAGSISNGLNMAKAEAVRRNVPVRFQLTTTADNTCALSNAGPSWVVSLDNPSDACGSMPSDNEGPRIIQVKGNENVERLVMVAAEHTAVFNSIGRQITNAVVDNVISIQTTSGPDACATIANKKGFRCLQINISPGGMVRVCDPAQASKETRSCTFGSS